MVSVNIRYTLNKKQELISLPVKVLKEYWIEQKQRVSSNLYNYRSLRTAYIGNVTVGE
jgi:hypothetical protein